MKIIIEKINCPKDEWAYRAYVRRFWVKYFIASGRSQEEVEKYAAQYAKERNGGSTVLKEITV